MAKSGVLGFYFLKEHIRGVRNDPGDLRYREIAARAEHLLRFKVDNPIASAGLCARPEVFDMQRD